MIELFEQSDLTFYELHPKAVVIVRDPAREMRHQELLTTAVKEFKKPKEVVFGTEADFRPGQRVRFSGRVTDEKTGEPITGATVRVTDMNAGVITDMDGKQVSGSRRPSSELAMHILIYKRRPDVNSVCHAHPPTATGYAAAGIPLNKAIVSEVVLSLGCIPVAPYATPGTPELTEALEPLVPNFDALLMANHGVVTYGPDLLTAFFRMETVEHFAQISLVTETLGKQALLSGRDVEKLLAARVRYGGTTASQVAPECPVTSENDAPERVT